MHILEYFLQHTIIHIKAFLLLSSYAATIRRQNSLLQAYFYKWQTATGTTENFHCYLYIRITSFYESLHPYKEGETPSVKENLVLRTYTKYHQLIKLTKISYSIVSLAFRKFSSVTYRNVLNRGTSKPGHSKYFKKYRPCRYYVFCREFSFKQLFWTRCGTSKIYLCLEGDRSSFSGCI